MEPEIFIMQGYEIHMFGENVGVTWDTHLVEEKTNDDVISTPKYVRESEPYIQFLRIIRDPHIEFRSVYDGRKPYLQKIELTSISHKFAETILKELTLAVEYIKTCS